MDDNNQDLFTSQAYSLAEKFMQHEKDKALKHNKKLEIKQEKEENKINLRKQKADKRKKLLEEASFSEMTTQQKIWSGIRLLFYAGMPFIMYMIMPAIVIAVGTILFSGNVKNIDEAYSQTATNMYTFIGIIAALIYLFRSARKRGSKVSEDITFTIKGLNWKYIGMMFLFGMSCAVFIASIYTLLPDSIMAAYDSYTLDPYNTYDVLLVLISLTILDPIAEEIVFRGYMLNRLLPPLGEKAAIWIVTIIFAICHLSIFWILYGVLLGWILAKISIRHDNIAYSIAIHIGFNLPTLFNYLITNNEFLNDLLFGNKLLIAIYGIVFGLAAYLLAIYYNKIENTGIDLRPRFFKNN